MTTPRTLTEIYFGALDRYLQRPVVMRRKVDGRWTDISYRQLADQVRETSWGLAEIGVRPGDRVAILAENRPEWAVADLACLTARCTDVPIYPTLPARQVEYVLRDSGAVAICVSTQAQCDKILEVKAELPALRHIIAFDPAISGADVISLAEVQARGRASGRDAAAWRAEALAATPDEVATFIYTSGTTGDPKGVMLTHGNITSNVVAGLAVLGLSTTDECLSFLPLSHIFERMAGHYVMLHAGVVINYATSVDTVAAELVEVRPTVVLSVPRLYEKIYARVLENALGGGALKRNIFFWAKRTGEEFVDLTLGRKAVPGGLAFGKRIADRLVFSKLRARTGGRLRFFVSGGAPLSPDIARFFHAAGLPILEGYGLTETSPVIAVNTFDALKIGTVGKPLPGVEVRIAEDGEILTRGPHVMKGYYQKPEATREAIDAEGWFHTGDIGELDLEGFLRITDRKKDIIVTAGGKNIAPQPIENMAKQSKFVANAVMLGDKRKFPIMLVVPNFENLQAWATHKGINFTDHRSLIALDQVRAKMERETLKTLRDLAQFEVPKKFLLIERDFTIESGELTPTMKVKRRVVERNYKADIEATYAEREGGPRDLDGR
ncbi:MAG TPA: long-chain fatty acid--CoA ligase [Gemmatimonadales bacterium]|nr:long-chain fatty acid--CoA ligase [Gemmatimonadales bacterium]